MVFGGENAESYYDEGLTANVKGDVAQAVKCFEKALQLDRSFLAAHHQLAKCYLRMGDGRRAVYILQQVVNRKPDQLPARLDLGFALLAVGHPEEARRHFAQVLAMDPTNFRAQLGVAQTCFDAGDWLGAITMAQSCLDNGGPSFAAFFLLGRAAKLAGEATLARTALERADAVIEKLIEAQPNQPDGHYLRAEVSFAREHYASALEQYRAAEDRMDSARTYSAFGETFCLTDVLAKQGLCCRRLNRLDKARELGARILEIDPEHKLGQALKDLTQGDAP